MTLMPGHLDEEQRKILRAVALAYRRVMRAPQEPAATRAEEARLAQKRQSEALSARDRRVSTANPIRYGRQTRGLRRGQPDDRSGDKHQSRVVLARPGCVKPTWIRARRRGREGSELRQSQAVFRASVGRS